MIPLLAFFILELLLLALLLAKQREIDALKRRIEKPKIVDPVERLRQEIIDNPKDYTLHMINSQKIDEILWQHEREERARNMAVPNIISNPHPKKYHHWAEKYDVCHDCHGVGGWRDNRGEWHNCEKCLTNILDRVLGDDREYGNR